MCPASGASATAHCSIKPTKTPAGKTRIQVIPEHPDRICTNAASTTIPFDAGAKYGQDLQYQSPEWQAFYGMSRQTIEGFNAYIKDGNREAVDQPSRRRLRGYAAQYLLVTIHVAAANLRKLGNYLDLTTKDLDRRAKRRAQRNGSLGDHLPEIPTPTSGAPPGEGARPNA